MYYGRYLQSGSSKTKFKLTYYCSQISSLAFIVSSAISQLVIAKQTIDLRYFIPWKESLSKLSSVTHTFVNYFHWLKTVQYKQGVSFHEYKYITPILQCQKCPTLSKTNFANILKVTA